MHWLEKIAKPHFLLSVERAGSTPISRLIAYYMVQHFNHEYFEELFDLEVDVPVRIDGEWYFSPNLRRRRRYLIEYFASEFRKYSNPIRHRYIKSKKDQVFFKAFPIHLDDVDIEKLRSRFSAFILYRKDTWQHLLSNLISRSTDRWYEPGGLSIPDKSVKVEEWSVKVYFDQLSRLKELELRFPDRRVIFFEDFLEKGPEKFLKHVGLDRPTDLTALKLPVKQNPGNKEDLIFNLDEVRSWYDSLLKANGWDCDGS